ncbi:MAG: PQQ-binding-like beta-propeller repeat protein [Pirellulaceae bacterium]
MRVNFSWVLLVVLGGISTIHAQETLESTEQVSAEWVQWRGPNRDSLLDSPVLSELNTLDSLEPKWRVPLNESYSGPIVAEGKVFVTETRDKKTEVVKALDVNSGEVVWEQQWDGAMSVPFFAKSNGDWIRATPIYDSGKLYVAGMCDVLVCLNAGTGDIEWRIDFVDQFKSGLPPFGNVPSPLIHGDYLYTQSGNAIVKINKQTGEIVWKGFDQDAGMMTAGAFSSPVVAKLGGVEQIVVQARTELAGVDLETGNVLWRKPIPSFRGMNILTPTILGDRVFTSTYQGGSFMLEIKHSGNDWTVEEVWTNPLEAYMSSPVVVDGNIYVHLRSKRFACLDAATGKERWVSKSFGDYWSMVAAGQRIMALDSDGELLLIEANPQEFKLLGQKSIADSSTWAHLGLVNDNVYVRELNAIAVYGLK